MIITIIIVIIIQLLRQFRQILSYKEVNSDNFSLLAGIATATAAEWSPDVIIRWLVRMQTSDSFGCARVENDRKIETSFCSAPPPPPPP